VSEGNSYSMYFSKITDHCRNETAVSIDDRFTICNGHHTPQKTGKGWFLIVLWKDGSLSWELLCDMKESHPIEVAEYAITNKLEVLISWKFNPWWVPYVLKKRSRTI
jgi:hypothetical protein